MDANSMAFVETSIVTKEGILDSYPNEQQKDQSELHSTHRSEHRGGMQGDGRDDIGHLRATTSRRSGTHNDDASEVNTETRTTGSLDDESNVANNDVSAVPCSLYQPTDLTNHLYVTGAYTQQSYRERAQQQTRIGDRIWQWIGRRN